MAFTLPDLPYPYDALAPHMSRETLEFHHDKHHQAYVTAGNNLAKGTEWENKPVEEVVKGTYGKNQGLFNNAAQHYNHSIYWKSLSPEGGGEPRAGLAQAVQKGWGSFASFREEFEKKATTLFGSGWCWLAKNGDKVEIQQASDADCPLTKGQVPLLACDVWEHAYYIDYRNERNRYLAEFWKIVNWRFAEQAFEGKEAVETAAVGAEVGTARRQN